MSEASLRSFWNSLWSCSSLAHRLETFFFEGAMGGSRRFAWEEALSLALVQAGGFIPELKEALALQEELG